MSAIFGLVNLDGRPVARHDLDLMGSALTSYGPDGNGVWVGEHVGLGQRLMCFTPEDRLEKQPLAGGEGHHVLITDGRIDNRPELTQELGISSSEASALPDSAFISRAYLKWGSECCGHLIGDFVFAVGDSHRGHLLLVRSAMSNRALFYHTAPGMFAFASAPRGLFALPWIPREIDQQSLADYLVLAPREPGRTLFAGVSELQSGQTLVVRREGLRFHQYWQPDPRREIRFPRDSEYVEAFNTLFDRVIADHLRSLTPVGVMMSGGLDSSSVAVTAARLLSPREKRLATFTEVPRAGFNGTLGSNRYADETPFVEAIARKCAKLDLNFVRTADCYVLDGIDPFFNALDLPFRAVWNRVWIEALLRQASDQNARVLLTGLPGNLTVSQEGHGLLPELICRGKWTRAFREAQACSRQNAGSSTLRVLARAAAQLLPTPLWYVVSRPFHHDNPLFAGPPWRGYSPIHPEFARLHRVKERASRRGHDFHFRVRSDTRANRYESLRYYWDSGIPVNRGYEALFGVEMRNPTGDARIVEFCLSLPEGQHRQDGVSRRLIRRAMENRLPPEVLANQRRGLQAADWFGQINAGRSRILDDLARIERCELAARALDLGWIRGLLKLMPEAGTGGRMGSHCRAILGSALMAGSFLCWFESSAGRRS